MPAKCNKHFSVPKESQLKNVHFKHLQVGHQCLVQRWANQLVGHNGFNNVTRALELEGRVGWWPTSMEEQIYRDT